MVGCERRVAGRSIFRRARCARALLCVFCAYKRVYCCIFIAAAGQQINLEPAPLSLTAGTKVSQSVWSLYIFAAALISQRSNGAKIPLAVEHVSAFNGPDRAQRLRPLFLLISFSNPRVCHTDTQFHFLGPFTSDARTRRLHFPVGTQNCAI